MGASRDDFTKYPRTPHLFGSCGTDDDKHLGQKESLDFMDKLEPPTWAEAHSVSLVG